ncbi:MAG: methyltransferase domain-containing protein [Acidimicrobiales bacterium]
MIEGEGALLDAAASPDAWDPVQYGRFAEERAQPFWDLVALIRPPPSRYGFGRCADLGCGSGELTAAVTEHFDIDEMVGIDSSDAMLAEARARPAAEDHRLRFAKGDIGRWTSRADHDLVVANASMQWLPDHPAVLERWWAALVPGGQLAVQVPANSDHKSHRVADQVATAEPFLSAFGCAPPPDPVAQNVLAPEQYAVVLDALGAEHQHVRLQVYPHRLKSSAEVVEWVKGTSLTRFTKLLDAELAEQFVAAYRERLLEAIGDTSPYFYPFKRILLWGRKAP